eukprot:PhF_6_TR23787/c1_g1_i1/m.33283
MNPLKTTSSPSSLPTLPVPNGLPPLPQQPLDKDRVMRELESMQAELELWHRRTNQEIQQTHQYFTSHLQSLTDSLQTMLPPGRKNSAPEIPTSASNVVVGNSNVTPLRNFNQSFNALEDDTPTASPPYVERRSVKDSVPMNYNLLFQELEESNGGTPSQKENKFHLQASAPPFVPSTGSPGEEGAAATTHVTKNGLTIVHGSTGRPTVQRAEGKSNETNISAADTSKIQPSLPCQVLVEFKRKRILQFESDHYIAPGDYVIVGGDRGEDVGLVIYSWQESPSGGTTGHGGVDIAQFTKWICMGLGKVIRLANPLEVSQLHGVQTELERRAIEVAQAKVQEHRLPMSIVDAEYQFDRKKLTFYYEAQQRLDFRDLVRDLYKAFRARIWMEMVETPTTTAS